MKPAFDNDNYLKIAAVRWASHNHDLIDLQERHGLDKRIVGLIMCVGNLISDDELRGLFQRDAVNAIPVGSDLSHVPYEVLYWVLQSSTALSDEFPCRGLISLTRAVLATEMQLGVKDEAWRRGANQQWSVVMHNAREAQRRAMRQPVEKSLAEFTGMIYGFAHSRIQAGYPGCIDLVECYCATCEEHLSGSSNLATTPQDAVDELAQALINSFRQSRIHENMEVYCA